MSTLRRCVNLTGREDAAAHWAARREFKLRRAWWRRVRYSPVIAGFTAMSEAMLDLARVVGRSEVLDSGRSDQ